MGSAGTYGGQPRNRCSHDASRVRNGRAGVASGSPRAHPRRPAPDDPVILPEWGKDVADRIPGAKYVELPGRNIFHFVESSFRYAIAKSPTIGNPRCILEKNEIANDSFNNSDLVVSHGTN